MVDIIPVTATVSKTKKGKLTLITIPKEFWLTPELKLNLEEQLYMRIVLEGHGLLITDKSNGKREIFEAIPY